MEESCRQCWIESHLNQTAKAEGPHTSSWASCHPVPSATLFTETLETRKDSLKGLSLTSFFSTYYSDMYVPNFAVLLNLISL